MKKRESRNTHSGKKSTWKYFLLKNPKFGYRHLKIAVISLMLMLPGIGCNEESRETWGCSSGPPPPSSYPPGSPTVETLAATNVTTTGATLNGRVTSMGSAASVSPYFEYGIATSYGSTRSADVLSSAGNFSAVISGLLPNTTYHFRAQLALVSLPGIDLTFTTLPPPPVLSLDKVILPMGIVGEVYSTDIRPTGGNLPYSFSVSGGVFPAGLRLTSLTDRCKIEGTPTEYGEFSFTITVRDGASTPSSASAAFKMIVVPNIAGKWAFSTTVTAAGGQCSEEVGRVTNTTITVVQSGTAVDFSGWVGNPTSLLSGSISTPSALTGGKWLITIKGTYPEDGGTTAATRTLTLDSPATMSGNETWSWSGPGGDCTGGLATMTVTKIPKT